MKREFNASKPNEKWVTDVTEFKYGKHNEKKLYLSLILDLYDRFPVGYEISEHNDNTLVFNTLKKAMEVIPKHSHYFIVMEDINIQVRHLYKCLKRTI